MENKNKEQLLKRIFKRSLLNGIGVILFLVVYKLILDRLFDLF